MRLFFLLLLLLNLGLFAWFYQQGVWSDGSAPAPPAVAATDPGVPMLQLVREQATEETLARVESPATPPPPPPPPPVVPEVDVVVAGERCVVVGPWSERSQAEQAVTLAGEAGIPALIEAVEREVAAGNWVLLEGRYNLAEARAILREMEGQGISDIAITPLEDGRHAISLGIYSRQGTLENRRQQLLRAGYVTEVRPRLQTEAAWSVLLALEAADLAPMTGLIDRLIELEPRTEWRDIDCR